MMADLAGKTFGRLQVMWPAGRDGKYKEVIWACMCIDGNIISTAARNLTNGDTKSCGCLRQESCSNNFRTHGLRKSPEYYIWASAKQRCTNPKDKRWYCYGARGIKFKFNGFEEFFAEVGPRPSTGHMIDRIDNNGNYEPGNVKWSTRIESRKNRREGPSVPHDRLGRFMTFS